MSLLTVEEMANDYGGIGDHGEDDVQLAIDLAEFDIMHAINTPLEPTTFTEEYIWPSDTGQVKLQKRRTNSITSVVGKHSLDCDCEWTEDTECGVILYADHSIIHIVACNLSCSSCCCTSYGGGPERAVITYIAGFTAAETAADTAIGKALRMAISLRTREWIEALEAGDFYEGEAGRDSWSSMDYSEQLTLVDTLNPIGPGGLSRAAWNLLKKLAPRSPVMIRGPGRV
jgi:hypothetical protein